MRIETYAQELSRGMVKIAGTADARIEQSSHYPELAVDIDRTRANQIGVTERDVTNTLVVNLASSMQVLGALGTIRRQDSDAIVSHYAIQPAVAIYATTQGRDLGAGAADIQRLIAQTAKDRPKGATVKLRGQVETMNTAFSGLSFGLAEAMILIYLLIVVNFQSWAGHFTNIVFPRGATTHLKHIPAPLLADADMSIYEHGPAWRARAQNSIRRRS